MPRNIGALYDTRAEAELARSRLISEVGARSPRIISRETAAAIETLGFGASALKAYRDGLRLGAHLVVAEVPSGASPKRIIAVLEQSMSGDAADGERRVWGEPEQGVEVRLPDEEGSRSAAEPENRAERAAWPPRAADEPVRAAGHAPVPAAEPAADPAAELAEKEVEPTAEEQRVPVVEDELRVGKGQVVRGGTRVRSFTREGEVEEQVSLQEEIVDVEHRPSERRLSDSEVEEAGLFRERVFEIAEMREEPVVSKVAVVREEIIVRKTITERQETVRDTVRHTEVEIDDLRAADEHHFGDGDERTR